MTIARPRVLADESAVFVDSSTPAHPLLDRMRRNVLAGGGREQVFLRALASGVAVGSEGGGAADDVGSDERMLDIAALAAWRSGLLAIRDDALARLRHLIETGRSTVAASALGIPAEAVAEFARRQQTDRFWWPGRERVDGYVLSVGGFAGLGGSWVRPPTDWSPFGDGSFALRVAGEWWRLDADAWGAHLRHGDERPDSGVPHVADGFARLVINDQTHLVWIHVAEAPR